MLIMLGILLFVVLPGAVVAGIARSVYLEYRPDRIPILLYHRLLSQADAEAGRVPDEEMIWTSYDTSFAEQMAYLHREGYTTLDFDDYLSIRAGQMPMPAKPVMVTFDDGYLSTYLMGFPVLKHYGHKATVFVALEPDQHTARQVAGFDGFVSAEQIRSMSDDGISIQSHTLTHCILTELDDEAVGHELNESRRRLMEITGRPVDHIAIPRAGHSRRIRRLVKEAGYRTACCNNKGSANGRSDPLALPRMVIERDMSIEDFAACLRPRAGVTLRIIGGLKRIPERVGGARFARRVRDILYVRPLRPIFRTRSLKKLVALAGVLYLAGAALFVWRLVAS